MLTLLLLKKDDTFCIYVDNRATYSTIIKYMYPSIRLNDILNFMVLKSSQKYSKKWMSPHPNEGRRRRNDNLQNKGGLYEWLVMHFEFSDGPNTFMNL